MNRFFKSSCLILLFFFTCTISFAQPGTKTGSSIAPFVIKGIDGKTFTSKQLKPNKTTVLIYFSPTCDHCKEFTKELLKHKDELKSKQFVIVGYEPITDIKKFDDQFHITSLPNFKIGTEGYTFIVQKYYGVQRFPFVAMYNKQMKLTKIVPFVTEPEQVSKEIASLP